MLIGNYENNSVAFVVIDSLITNIITGTDTGSTIIQSLLRVIVAAAILIGVVMSIGRKGI
jgi:archaellum biogenesis protein FlaJ (TadC family)